MNISLKNRRWYYAVIVLSCFLLSASCTGFLNNFNTLFLSTVSEALMCQRAQLTLYSTFSSITTMLCLPIAGKLYRKIPIRLLVLIGALAGASAHLLYSLATTVWLFYLGGVLAGICASLACTIPINLTLSNWFHEKRGLATGFVYTGSSLISSLFAPVISKILIHGGWRIAYRSISAGIILISLPFLFFIRPTPASVALKPYGANEGMSNSTQIQSIGFTQKQARRLPSFWLFSIGIFLLGAITSGTQHHLVAYWESISFSQEAAAKIYSYVLFSGVVGKILVGILLDHLQIRPVLFICILVEICAFASILHSGPLILPSAILFGLTTAFQIILPAYLTQRFWGTLDYVSNMGLITSALYLGASCGSPTSALIYDLSGDYRLTWILFIILGSIAFFCFFLANHLSKHDFYRQLGLRRKE